MSVRCTFRRMICGVFAIACVMLLGYGIMAGIRHDRTMHVALMQLQADNQAYTIFTSDSAARALVRYFDHPWHNANDRLLAYYLLGRAHADMGEAPQAIEDYQTAIERADTTAADCDFRLLRNVYGQMADVYDAQNLPEDELKANQMFIYYSWIIGDSIQAVEGYRSTERCYDLLGKPDSILIVDSIARIQLLSLGDTIDAARTLLAPIYIYSLRAQFDKAKRGIDLIRAKADVFNDDGSLQAGREMYYYTLGFYHDGVNQLDSAEYYYRLALAAGEAEAGYKGLLSVYGKLRNTDSIVKYAPLYADANDASHDSLRTAEVHKTASLYNYNRHLKDATRERLAKQKTQTVLLVISLITICLVVYGYHVLRRYKEEKARMAKAYLQAVADLNATQKEITILRKEKYHLEGLESLLQSKEKKVAELKTQIDVYRAKLHLSKGLDSVKETTLVEIIQLFHGMAEARTIKDGDSARLLKPRGAKVAEWKMMRQAVQQCYPSFYLTITTQYQLSDQELKVCILSRLQFDVKEMATLLNTSIGSISNARQSIAKKIFDISSAMRLDQKLAEL